MTLKKLFLILATLLWATSLNAAQYIPDSSISPAFTRDAEIIPTGETNAVCVGNTGTPTPSISLCATVDLTGKTVYYKPPEVAIASLPANHGIVIVTDAASSASCTVAGGSTKVPCWWNGTTWTPMGAGGTGGTGDVTDVIGTTNEICMTASAGPIPQVGLCATLALTAKTIQLGRLDLAGDITPTGLTANANDWNPTGLSTASTIRFATNAIWSITGLQGGADGRLLTLYNVGSFATIFPNESSSSTAGNRFAFGSDIIVGPNQGLILQYDAVVSGGRWRALTIISNPAASAYCDATGSTGDAYACNLSPPITAYTVGAHYFFKASGANTGAATLALNGIASPVTIKKPVGGATTDLGDNDIRTGQIVEVVYDGAYFQMVSQLGNAPGGLSGLAIGCLSKAASSTTINDSTVCEDADSINSSKKIEIGDVSTNSVKIQATGITGKIGIQAATLRKRNIAFVIGSDAGANLTNSDGQLAIYENQLAAFHVTSIKCRTDTGTSTINVARSGTNILSSNLVCTTGGATSTSFSSGIDAIAVGQLLDFVMVTAATSGTPKRISVTITVVIDSE